MAIIHIGEKIKSRVKKNGMSVSEFSRRIKTSRENVYSIFKRKSIDTDLLVLIGIALEYDFFAYYTTVGEEIEMLRKEIDALKTVVSMATFKKA